MGYLAELNIESVLIDTANLALRPWRIKEVHELYAAIQDSRFQQSMLHSDPLTQANAAMAAIKSVVSHPRSLPVAEFAITRLNGNAVVGSALVKLSDPRTAAVEIDYALYPSFANHGHEAEVLGALVSWVLECGAARVELVCGLGNMEKAKTALACGFRFEGVLRCAIATLHGLENGSMFARLPEDSGAPMRQAFPDLPPEGLSDGVITLRVAAGGDVDALHVEQTNVEARRWSLIEPLSRGDIASRAEKAALEWLVGPNAFFVIVDQESGNVAGRIILRAVVPPQVADVGYGVLPAFRGRRFAARALQLLSEWAFTQANYVRLELGVKPGNVASRTVAEAGGFRFDGMRQSRLRNSDGTFSDELHFVRVNPACLEPEMPLAIAD